MHLSQCLIRKLTEETIKSNKQCCGKHQSLAAKLPRYVPPAPLTTNCGNFTPAHDATDRFTIDELWAFWFWLVVGEQRVCRSPTRALRGLETKTRTALCLSALELRIVPFNTNPTFFGFACCLHKLARRSL